MGLVTQRRRRVEKVAYGEAVGSEQTLSSPGGATQFNFLAKHTCAAPPALVIVYHDFPALTSPDRANTRRDGDP